MIKKSRPRVLVIGGAGFVGSNFVRYFLNNHDGVLTVLDSLDPHFQSTCDSLNDVWEQINFIRGSVGDEKLISELVQDQDVIINLAGQSSHTLSLQYPLLDAEINCVAHLKLLEAVRFFNPEATVVYASSSTVVGKSQDDIVDENHAERPLEIYSANKGVAEKYYRIYNKFHGLKTIILRFANLYGAYGKADSNFGFVNHFIAKSFKDEALTVFGQGEQTRNVMYVEDACEILWKASQESELFGEICFATSPHHFTVKEIAQKIIDVFESGHLTFVAWPAERKKMDVDRVLYSSEKLRAVTGWTAKHDLYEGLKKTKDLMSRSEWNAVQEFKPFGVER